MKMHERQFDLVWFSVIVQHKSWSTIEKTRRIKTNESSNEMWTIFEKVDKFKFDQFVEVEIEISEIHK